MFNFEVVQNETIAILTYPITLLDAIDSLMKRKKILEVRDCPNGIQTTYCCKRE